jgi:glutamyl-tRNA reductase
MPRNIDPLSGTLDNVFLHDIDDLFHIVDKNLDNRKREIPKINEIVFEQLKEFDQWHNSLQINPTIQQLRDQFEQIRQAEVEKYLHRFSPESQEEVALITKRIINKILHVPTVNLRKETSGKKADSAMKTISILRSLFDLNARVPR